MSEMIFVPNKSQTVKVMSLLVLLWKNISFLKAVSQSMLISSFDKLATDKYITALYFSPMSLIEVFIVCCSMVIQHSGSSSSLDNHDSPLPFSEDIKIDSEG